MRKVEPLSKDTHEMVDREETSTSLNSFYSAVTLSLGWGQGCSSDQNNVQHYPMEWQNKHAYTHTHTHTHTSNNNNNNENKMKKKHNKNKHKLKKKEKKKKKKKAGTRVRPGCSDWAGEENSKHRTSATCPLGSSTAQNLTVLKSAHIKHTDG